MADYYNSKNLSNPPHYSIKIITATLLNTLQQSQFKVHKISRMMNTTANTLARQAFNSNAVSTNFSCFAILHRELPLVLYNWPSRP
jgi:hypothetical protein